MFVNDDFISGLFFSIDFVFIRLNHAFIVLEFEEAWEHVLFAHLFSWCFFFVLVIIFLIFFFKIGDEPNNDKKVKNTEQRPYDKIKYVAFIFEECANEARSVKLFDKQSGESLEHWVAVQHGAQVESACNLRVVPSADDAQKLVHNNYKHAYWYWSIQYGINIGMICFADIVEEQTIINIIASCCESKYVEDK